MLLAFALQMGQFVDSGAAAGAPDLIWRRGNINELLPHTLQEIQVVFIPRA